MKKNFTYLCCICAWIGGAISLKAQIGINADNSLPHASAMLEIKSNNKGILFPRMTFAERNTIFNPAIGLIVYQTDILPGLYHYTIGGWKNLNTSAVISYLQAVSENNNDGYRLYGRDTVQHGNIGADAIDLSSTIAGGGTNNYGATGDYSFAVGLHVKASGHHSLALGLQNISSGVASVSLGLSSNATGNMAFAMGNKANATKLHSFAFGELANASQINAVAIGKNTVASGTNAVAIGYANQATGNTALAFGYDTRAIANYANAFGYQTTGSGLYSTAMGFKTVAFGSNATAMGANTNASGTNATAMGKGTMASGTGSTAIGTTTTASGPNATAIGINTVASGVNATAMGSGTNASGLTATAIGATTTASGNNSVAMGASTTASGLNTTAMGANTRASGVNATTMGNGTIASGLTATAIGTTTTASGNNSVSMGINTIASSANAIATGNGTNASGIAATAMGSTTTASGNNAVAMGTNSVASGVNAVASGNGTTASGIASTSIGSLTTASGDYAMATGVSTTASGSHSTATGANTTASGNYATAQGFGTTATGKNSMTSGEGTQAKSYGEIAVGSYNTDYTAAGATTFNAADRALNVGIGSSASDKKDGLVVYKNGTLTLHKLPVAPVDTAYRLYVYRDKLTYNGERLETSQLERITANNKVGYRVYGKNAANYGEIGQNATDLSHSDAASTGGATGTTAFATGYKTKASGNNATALGENTIATGAGATAMGGSTTASGLAATAMGATTTASGDFSTAMGVQTTAAGIYATTTGLGTTASGKSTTASGEGTQAKSYAETVVGAYNTDYTPMNATASNPADRAFVVGIGTAANAQKDGWIIYKDGTTALNKLTVLPTNTDRLYVYNNSLYYNNEKLENSQLQKVTQNSKTGHRLLGKVAANYGEIGQNATDLSHSDAASTGGATGTTAFATGYKTKASGNNATALGESTVASGVNATALGGGTTASGLAATSIGASTTASGDFSTAMGVQTTASGVYSTAQGLGTTASGKSATTSGEGTQAKSYAETVVGAYNTDYTPANAMASNPADRAFVVGIGTAANAQKDGWIIYKDGTAALNKLTVLPTNTDRLYVYNNSLYYNNEKLENSQLQKVTQNSKTGHRLLGKVAANYGEIGQNATDLSHSDVASTNGATGTNAFATGYKTKASGNSSTALGEGSVASNSYSAAIGAGNTASGAYATALGGGSTASGAASTSMGSATMASGDYATAMGAQTTATGSYATAQGFGTTAVGKSATAAGEGTQAKSYAETVVGAYNTDYTPANATASNLADRAFVVGIGTAANAKKDGLIVYKDGTLGLNPLATTPAATTNRLYAVNNQLMYNGAMIGETSQVQRLTQNGNTGYRLFAENAAQHGAIGDGALDLCVALPGTSNMGATGTYSVALGPNTKATAFGAMSFGGSTTASGYGSVAIGATTTASGNFATAMGGESIASGTYSMAVGSNTKSKSYAEMVIGSFNTDYTPASATASNTVDRAFVIGIGTSDAARKDGLIVYKDGSLGLNSATTAPNTTTNRLYVVNNQLMYNGATIGAPSELQKLTQNGNTGYRFLGANVANYGPIGANAVDLSQSTVASTTNGATGLKSFAFGTNNKASGDYSTALGYSNTASGLTSMTFGSGNSATATNTTAIGQFTTASGEAAIAMGNGTRASGNNSTAMGSGSVASGTSSFAVGNVNNASGDFGVAIGSASVASGITSFATGNATKASANFSSSFGNGTIASGVSSFVAGDGGTVAAGHASTSMGWNTKATADASVAFGNNSLTSGHSSAAIGLFTIAKSFGEVAVGAYNTEYTPTGLDSYNASDRAFVVGIGSSGADRKDGLVIFKNGSAIFGNGASTQKAKVYIEGGKSVDLPTSYTYLAHNITPNVSPYTGNFNLPVSLYADNRILASEFNAFSDKRIKDVIGQSNIQQDLDVLAKIRITDYTMKDKIQYGNKSYKKVIAQELKTVYPQAVSYSTSFIPNIYKAAAVQEGWVNLQADVTKGDKMRIITTTGQQEVMVEAVESNRFKVNLPNAERVFFFGKEVNDFHIVDYEALTTLNISATQALLDEVQQLKAQNTALKSQVESLNQLKAEVQQIKAMIQADKVSIIKQ